VPAPPSDPRVDTLARLAVEVGANVQPGQVVALGGRPGQEEMVRALARHAYRRGARFVDLAWFDPHLKLARIVEGGADDLEWVPPWYGERFRRLGEMGAALVALAGPTSPGLFDGVDPALVGRDRLPSVREATEIVMSGAVNWTVVPCPNPAWAALVFPDLAPGDALARLWDEIAHVCRLDTPDPAAAWRERGAELGALAARLTARRMAALRFRGPGTDLTVRLLPGSRWVGGGETRSDGLPHLPNLPTEEVFTTPDPEGTQGVVRSTRPLELGGALIRGLRVRFAGGRAVEIDADEGAELLRARARVDAGAARLGEVALVDGASRIGGLGTVFLDTLLDENATSHIAIGAGYPMGVDEGDAGRINRSEIHVDFMIGGPDVTVSAVDGEGRESPLLEGGAWRDV